MKLKLMFFALCVSTYTAAFAQKKVVENAIKDVALVPSQDTKVIDNQKPCDVFNKSSTRTITVKIEESTLVNNFLQKKIIAIENIGPNQHKFIGYAGCDDNAMYGTCTGYKIAIAYYEENEMDSPQRKDEKVAKTVTTIGDKAITSK